MKKVFLCAILASLSYPAIASSLQDQLSAVAEAEQQGKNEEQRQHDEWVAEPMILEDKKPSVVTEGFVHS
ncbi:hypothetical protein OPV26_000675 [Escherichia coli]|nr:hypothetical protein [Escherichia coli]